MKYTFHIVDVFSSTPFGGNQLAVLPNEFMFFVERRMTCALVRFRIPC
jgi:predicted PhzF superfamily epimerase YddE/YHI9